MSSYCIIKLIPEQVWTFLSVYQAKKSVGSAQSKEVYFSICERIIYEESICRYQTGRKATPTSISIFDSYDMKTL